MLLPYNIDSTLALLKTIRELNPQVQNHAHLWEGYKKQNKQKETKNEEPTREHIQQVNKYDSRSVMYKAVKAHTNQRMS